MRTMGLLIISNTFMTFAWYGHLKFFEGNEVPYWKIILISWGIAFFEYCFMVPANRLGFLSGEFTASQLKIVQEIITLLVFVVFSVFFLKESFKWNHAVAFGFMILAAMFMFKK